MDSRSYEEIKNLIIAGIPSGEFYTCLEANKIVLKLIEQLEPFSISEGKQQAYDKVIEEIKTELVYLLKEMPDGYPYMLRSLQQFKSRIEEMKKNG